MDKKLEAMLESLDIDIERKCFELQQKRHDVAMKRVFMVCCMLFIIVPATLVLFGLSIITSITWTTIFILVCAAVLLPVILESISGGFLR